MRRTLATVAVMLLGLLAAVGRPAAAAPDAAEPASAKQDATAKEEILNSQAWRNAMIGYNEWLSVQVLYDKSQAARMKAELKDKVAKMSAAQLQAFLADLQAKLAILSSKQAMEVRGVVEGTLNVLTDAAAAKYRQRLPDIANMNAAQIQQALINFQQQQAADAASEKAFQQSREAQVAAVTAAQKANAEAYQRALDRATYSAANNPGYGGGYYAPRRSYYDPNATPNVGIGGWWWW